MADVEANKALIKKVYEEGFSNNNIHVMDEAFTEDYICRFPDLEPIVCQSAWNRDPLSACKRDPSAASAWLRGGDRRGAVGGAMISHAMGLALEVFRRGS